VPGVIVMTGAPEKTTGVTAMTSFCWLSAVRAVTWAMPSDGSGLADSRFTDP